ncbi:MAG: hypothetical protein IPI02_01180 [Sterolibacteriaceae bacterium]|nr:hypothetical protein [Sterolibacteriaceae bacterium]
MLQSRHHRVAPEGVVPAHQLRLVFCGQFIENLEQTGLSMLGRVFVAGTHFDTQDQPQTRHQVRVIGMGRASVAADLNPVQR